MYYEDILNDIKEYAFMYSSTFFDNIDDERFIEDVIENEKENFEIENIHFSEILKYVKSIIPYDEYEKYLANKIDADDDLDDEEKEEAKSNIDIDEVSESDLIDMIEDLNYSEEIIDECMENRYRNYSAKDYIEEIYGRVNELDKHTYDWLYNYLNDSEFARSIADDESEEYLEDRYQ